MALTTERDTKRMGNQADPADISLPAAATALIYQGGIVCDNGSGYAVKGTATTGLIAAGIAQQTVDNSAGDAGDLNVPVKRGVFLMANSSGDALDITDRFGLCYIEDDQTVCATGTGKSIAGVVFDVTSAGVYVGIGVSNALAYASLSSDVSALNTDSTSAQIRLGVPLATLRETTNFDVGNITANGGLLASDTTPILSAINDATDGCQRVTWAASNNDQVMFQFTVPADLDDTADIKLYTRIASGGTTNAVGFSVASYFDEGDTAVADTSATNQTTTYANALTTIAAADVPAGASTMTVGLTPVAHTTDTLNLTAVWIEYTRKQLTS